jgi:hypothetical protein
MLFDVKVWTPRGDEVEIPTFRHVSNIHPSLSTSYNSTGPLPLSHQVLLQDLL